MGASGSSRIANIEVLPAVLLIRTTLPVVGSIGIKHCLSQTRTLLKNPRLTAFRSQRVRAGVCRDTFHCPSLLRSGPLDSAHKRDHAILHDVALVQYTNSPPKRLQHESQR